MVDAMLRSRQALEAAAKRIRELDSEEDAAHESQSPLAQVDGCNSPHDKKRKRDDRRHDSKMDNRRSSSSVGRTTQRSNQAESYLPIQADDSRFSGFVRKIARAVQQELGMPASGEDEDEFCPRECLKVCLPVGDTELTTRS